MLSFASSERSTRPREGLSDAVSVPRTIKPLLEGFDPARRPLLFLWNFGLVRLLETGRAQVSKSGNGLRRDQQFARTVLKTRKHLRQLAPAAIAGYSAWCIMIPLRQTPSWVSAVLEELRRRSPRLRVSPRSETARRAVARSASIANQVR